MQKVYFIIISFVTFILVSCSQLAGGGTSGYYYQQQSTVSKDSTITGPSGDWDDGGGEEVVPPTLAAGEISMFSAYQKNGVVFSLADSDVATTLTEKLMQVDFNNTSTYDDWKFFAKFSGANVPEMWYTGTVSWNGSLDSWQNYSGANSSAGSNSISNMNYMRAVGFNPFYSYSSSYNTAEYSVYEGSTNTGTTEAMMKRFVFYRFTGKGGGVAALDNYLVAVDTYTSLVFPFAKPTKWGSLLGNAVPEAWGPIDAFPGPGGAIYNFYEYDPVGYVSKDGKFNMTNSYKNNLAAGNYDPEFTGKSPYLGVLTEDGGVEGGGGETGYPVSGVLTVKAKHIKNVSMYDSAWGDHGNADSTSKPEFIYSVRSRAYTGFEAGDWNVMSSYRPDDTSMVPASAKFIEIGSTLQLGGGKQYTFDNIKEGITLELDSRLIEIGITSNVVLTDYESPIVFLGYDRYSQKWKPTVDNATYMYAPPEYDEDFAVGLGETNDFIVAFTTPGNGKMEIVYEISWETNSSTAAGKIFSADLKEREGYEFSGSNGTYLIECTDNTEAESIEAKTISFDITIGNLVEGHPIVLTYEIPDNDRSFIESIRFGENNKDIEIITTENSTIKVDIVMRSDPSLTQEDTIKLLLKDESGFNIYDTANSPSIFEVTLIRNTYIVIDNAEFIVSNMKLKNISLMDYGIPYEEGEFVWNVKTQHNETGWKTLTNQTSKIYVETGSSTAMSGTTNHIIINPREGSQFFYVSADIFEKDTGADDVILRHGQPNIQFEYQPFTDSWNLAGNTSYFYTDSDSNQWKITSISMDELIRSTDDKNNKQTVTVQISANIKDDIWPVFLEGVRPAGWGDMELSFDVEWK